MRCVWQTLSLRRTKGLRDCAYFRNSGTWRFSTTARHEGAAVCKALGPWPLTRCIPNNGSSHQRQLACEAKNLSTAQLLFQRRRVTKCEVDKQSAQHAPASHSQAIHAPATEDGPTRVRMSCCERAPRSVLETSETNTAGDPVGTWNMTQRLGPWKCVPDLCTVSSNVNCSDIPSPAWRYFCATRRLNSWWSLATRDAARLFWLFKSR